ncbi:hypothetical protein [Limnoglobus roseus]|uniref:TIGR02996 domain-containing protein n=1 Tax=Limnoglobus roseus TaxID=2598579 RepID=A0A5C1AIC7_9BACT|nr:hypothetical protein [Limnoglobus roseus]QEL17432.1 hypothetical protein PX52LOC_04421 [Limnoglobus roseus]
MREAEFQRTQYGVTRTYRMRRLDDPPERTEAVNFFETVGEIPWLHSAINLPEFLHGLPIEEANEYLSHHPIREEYSCLVLWEGELIHDDDLRCIEHLPELEIVRLHSDNITDAGVSHLRYLRQVDVFELYSSRVTDVCLDVIRQLRTIRLLDLQGCRQLSRGRCEEVARELGVQESWLPETHAEPVAAPDPALS